MRTFSRTQKIGIYALLAALIPAIAFILPDALLESQPWLVPIHQGAQFLSGFLGLAGAVAALYPLLIRTEPKSSDVFTLLDDMDEEKRRQVARAVDAYLRGDTTTPPEQDPQEVPTGIPSATEIVNARAFWRSKLTASSKETAIAARRLAALVTVDEAFELLKQATELDAHDTWAWIEFSRAAATAGKLQNASDAAHQALKNGTSRRKRPRYIRRVE